MILEYGKTILKHGKTIPKHVKTILKYVKVIPNKAILNLKKAKCP